MYDVIVIGGGPGGYKTAELCGKNGLKVALVEERSLGGTCLNEGCIPFKSYLHFSRLRAETARCESLDLTDGKCPGIRMDALLQYKKNVVSNLQSSVSNLLRISCVDLFNATGKITGNDADSITVKAGDEVLEGKNVVLATGAVERRLPVPVGLSYRVIYSRDMLEMETVPDSVDIIGGGVIGLEAASFYSDLGARVAVFEVTDKIGGRIDGDIAERYRDILENKGVEVFTGTEVREFNNDHVVYERNGKQFTRTPQCVLICIGRKPSFDRKMLDAAGIQYNDKGIVSDDSCMTTAEHVYAVGDCTGNMMLAHYAFHQAKIVSDCICGKNREGGNLVIPRIIYSNPEILTVGLTEEECKGIEYTAKVIPMTYSGKYFAENGKDGAVAKMIIDSRKRIIGFHMIGNTSSEISLAAELLISRGATVDEMQTLIYPHPTYCEILGELASMFKEN